MYIYILYICFSIYTRGCVFGYYSTVLIHVLCISYLPNCDWKLSIICEVLFVKHNNTIVLDRLQQSNPLVSCEYTSGYSIDSNANVVLLAVSFYSQVGAALQTQTQQFQFLGQLLVLVLSDQCTCKTAHPGGKFCDYFYL